MENEDKRKEGREADDGDDGDDGNACTRVYARKT